MQPAKAVNSDWNSDSFGGDDNDENMMLLLQSHGNIQYIYSILHIVPPLEH